MKTKRLALSIILILSATLLFAQNDRLNHWIVRTSYDYLFYLPQDDGKLLDPHKSIGGLSVELGARQYFFKTCFVFYVRWICNYSIIEI